MRFARVSGCLICLYSKYHPFVCFVKKTNILAVAGKPRQYLNTFTVFTTLQATLDRRSAVFANNVKITSNWKASNMQDEGFQCISRWDGFSLAILSAVINMVRLASFIQLQIVWVSNNKKRDKDLKENFEDSFITLVTPTWSLIVVYTWNCSEHSIPFLTETR